MNEYKWKTKKEIILENAYRDPFLKIDDLAKKANTTSRYVRTILSESNISLMDLRKKYAKEKDFAREKVLAGCLLKVPFKKDEKIVKCETVILNNTQDMTAIQGNINEKFLLRSFIHQVSDRPWYLSTFLLSKKCFNNTNIDQIKDIYESISIFIKKDDISLSNISLDVEIATGQIANCLDITTFAPILKVKQIIENNSCLVLNIIYFDYNQVSLALSFNGGLIINRKNIAV